MITISRPLTELIDLYQQSLEHLIHSSAKKSIFMFETEVIIELVTPKIYGQLKYCKVTDATIFNKSLWMTVDVKYSDLLIVNAKIKVQGCFSLKQKENGNISMQIKAHHVESVENITEPNPKLIDIIKQVPYNPIKFPLKQKINLCIILPKSNQSQSQLDIFNKLNAPNIQALLNITSIHCDMKNVIDISRAIKSKPLDTDVLAITRGGGDEFDIAIFDNIKLYSELAKCYCHRVLGIGHTNDRLLLEMVSDYTAQTPSDLADYIILQIQHNNEFINTKNELDNSNTVNKQYLAENNSLKYQIQEYEKRLQHNDSYIEKTQYDELSIMYNQKNKQITTLEEERDKLLIKIANQENDLIDLANHKQDISEEGLEKIKNLEDKLNEAIITNEETQRNCNLLQEQLRQTNNQFNKVNKSYSNVKTTFVLFIIISSIILFIKLL